LCTCLGQASKAVEVLTRSIELDPNSAWSMGLLAFALTCCNRADEAIVHLTTALHLSPRDAAVHWYLAMLAWAYLHQAHYDDAAREAQRSIIAFSGWSVAWATLAVARAGLGQFEEARPALETCRKLDEYATRAGYAKFFAYIVRDGGGRKAMHDWLDELWVEAGP
jgi:predicted Zn-dependent protease